MNEHSSKLTTVMEALYDSEINCSVSCFWDNGWDVKLGDPMNGYKAEANFRYLWEAADWLKTEAMERYPDSQFAIAARAGSAQ